MRNTTGAGLPLSVGASEKHFKSLFFDIGLSQRLLGLDYSTWLDHSTIIDKHRGSVAEQFVGQELLHRSGDHEDPGLYYWHRMKAGAQAEVDYLCETDGYAAPVEVKSSRIGHLRSKHLYLNSFPATGIGIKCSLDNFGRYGNIINVPLYVAARIPEFVRMH